MTKAEMAEWFDSAFPPSFKLWHLSIFYNAVIFMLFAPAPFNIPITQYLPCLPSQQEWLSAAEA
jgi:hypothetical protein